jgi:hypothetical protein
MKDKRSKFAWGKALALREKELSSDKYWAKVGEKKKEVAKKMKKDYHVGLTHYSSRHAYRKAKRETDEGIESITNSHD